MSYTRPLPAAVDATWQDATAYTRQLPNAADATWNGCAYIAPANTAADFSLAGGTYNAPPALEASFSLLCGDTIIAPIDISGASAFTIGSDGLISINLVISGTTVFDPIGSDGAGVRGEAGYSFGRLGPIVSVGFIEITPYLVGETTFPEIVSVTNPPIMACVIGSFVNMEFDTGIEFQRGRVIYGDGVAPMYREVYEISNNRTIEIKAYPEDCPYPIFVGDTRTDKDDNDLRIGTIDYLMSFDHDTRDMDYINVWVTEPSGHSFKAYELSRPFRDHEQLRIPIHCITNKANQFHLEIVYETTIAMANTERYLIPFQPHFDNRNPYLNISDQMSSVTGNAGIMKFDSEYVEVSRIYQTLDELAEEHSGANATKSIVFDSDYVEFSRLFLFLDDITEPVSGANATPFTNFTYITDNLGSIQIGG